MVPSSQMFPKQIKFLSQSMEVEFSDMIVLVVTGGGSSLDNVVLEIKLVENFIMVKIV